MLASLTGARNAPNFYHLIKKQLRKVVEAPHGNRKSTPDRGTRSKTKNNNKKRKQQNPVIVCQLVPGRGFSAWPGPARSNGRCRWCPNGATTPSSTSRLRSSSSVAVHSSGPRTTSTSVPTVSAEGGVSKLFFFCSQQEKESDDRRSAAAVLSRRASLRAKRASGLLGCQNKSAANKTL